MAIVSFLQILLKISLLEGYLEVRHWAQALLFLSFSGFIIINLRFKNVTYIDCDIIKFITRIPISQKV